MARRCASLLGHLLLSSLLLSTFLAGTWAQTYNVINNCPTAIELFVGQASQGSLAVGATTSFKDLGPSVGFFYASDRGGVVDGNTYAARVGFYFQVRLVLHQPGLEGARF